ncbi:MAG: DUF1365 family protein [Mycobacterium sp.]
METDSTPALYPTRVTHLHRAPVHHYAEHRSYSWFVDIDDLPRLPWWLRPFARFDGADHFTGGPNETLRQRVDAFLATHDVFLPGGRITALLLPRVLGRAFNPLSLFWCHDAAGALRCVVAEVQDTHGERTAYLVPPGEDSPVPVAGALRDAPAHNDDGYFLVRVPQPGEKLDLTVSQHRDNHAAMVATWRGDRRRASTGQILLMQLAHPLAPQMAVFSMRFQALVLRMRGLSAPPRAVAQQPDRIPQTTTVHSAASGWTGHSRSWAPS